MSSTTNTFVGTIESPTGTRRDRPCTACHTVPNATSVQLAFYSVIDWQSLWTKKTRLYFDFGWSITNLLYILTPLQNCRMHMKFNHGDWRKMIHFCNCRLYNSSFNLLLGLHVQCRQTCKQWHLGRLSKSKYIKNHKLLLNPTGHGKWKEVLNVRKSWENREIQRGTNDTKNILKGQLSKGHSKYVVHSCSRDIVQMSCCPNFFPSRMAIMRTMMLPEIVVAFPQNLDVEMRGCIELAHRPRYPIASPHCCEASVLHVHSFTWYEVKQ